MYQYLGSETGHSKQKNNQAKIKQKKSFLVRQRMIVDFNVIQRGKQIGAKLQPKALSLFKGPIHLQYKTLQMYFVKGFCL